MKINIGVFFGGRSVEHEVSIISALQAVRALNKEKYNPILIYISKSGEMHVGPALSELDNYKDEQKLQSSTTKISLINYKGECLALTHPSPIFGKNVFCKIDIAMPVIHGTNGEDGTLQGLFEHLNIPYVGCDTLSSAVCMDKVSTKLLLRGHGLPVVDGVWFSAKEWHKDPAVWSQKIENELSYPVIVKPSNLGSSIGVSKASNKQELENSIDLAFNFCQRVLVEKAVQNLKEINCSVLGDYESSKTSECEEPVSQENILSYSDKYLNKSGSKGMSGLSRKLPADISPEIKANIQKIAKDAFYHLGCCGVIRIDFLMDCSSGELYLNEINTIPGSLSFYLWEAAGLNFENMLEEIISLALKRHRERQLLTFSYKNNILSMGGGLKNTK